MKLAGVREFSGLWPGMGARRHNCFLASGRRPLRQHQIKSK